MSIANFHIYVLARAQVGLYRTLLSVWKLETRPNLVTILYPNGEVNTIEKSIYTVSEDTSDQGPQLRLLDNSSGLQVHVLNDALAHNFDITGFLVERDMLLPNYGEIITKGITISKILGLNYFQRRRFGNSRSTHHHQGIRNPLSTLVLPKSQVENFLNHSELLPKDEIILSVPIDSDNRSVMGRVLVQSNIRSPFDL